MHLMAWSGQYGFRAFEVFIAIDESLEKKRKYIESLGYKTWLWTSEELEEYELNY